MLFYARLGVSRPIYVNVDTPYLGFPYFNFLGGYQLKKHPVYQGSTTVTLTPEVFHLQTKFFSVAQYDGQAHSNILQVNIEVARTSSWYEREKIGVPPEGKIIAG